MKWMVTWVSDKMSVVALVEADKPAEALKLAQDAINPAWPHVRVSVEAAKSDEK